MLAALLPHEHFLCIYQVETIASVVELLLETLADLSDRELESFKVVVSLINIDRSDVYRYYSPILWMQPETKDMQDIVFLMVLTNGQTSVEKTKVVLKRMERTDLVQRLSNSSRGPKSKKSKNELKS